MIRIVCFIVGLLCIKINAQQITIRGEVFDRTTNEELLYSACYDSISCMGTTSNSSGRFNFKAKENQHVALTITHIGYYAKTIIFTALNDTNLIIYLAPKNIEIGEVTINDYFSMQKQDVLGKIIVPVSTIQSLPSFVGIPDLMKAITFIPGISTGKEGYSNLYVRGGDRGQNLILLDGIKLYNTNHVGGFLSLLNTDILKHIDVYKGGFPARFGGRASSVIDIYSKDGNKNKLHGKLNLGVLNSGIMLEGPLGNNVSFFFSGRTSYYDLFTISSRQEYNNSGEGEFYGYTFFDINSKITWQASKKHKFSLAFFTGHDYQKYVLANKLTFQIYDETDKLNIHNTGISVQHRFRISPKLFLENSMAYTNYNNSLSFSSLNESDGTKIKVSNTSYSKIDDFTVKSKLDFYYSNWYTLRAGLEANHYNFMPGIQRNIYENYNIGQINDTTIGFTNALNSSEISLFQENELDVSKSLKVNAGIRGTGYFCKDTAYFKIEPRLSLRWMIINNLSFKSSFTIMNQFNHVLVNNIEGFEREIWFSATKDIPPQVAKQSSAGLFYGNQDIEISVEGYYKKMKNLTEYRSPVNQENNLDNISNIVAKNGIGESYGLEIMVKKAFKRINTNLNYSLSWNNRKFETLNNGNWYPFLYDRRHDVSLVVLYQINKVYSVGSNFIFTSGAPVTLPNAFSTPDDLVFKYFIYEGINNKRLLPYHRTDVVFTRKIQTKKGNISLWTLNIFNLYARQNPVYIYYDSNTGRVKQRSLFSIVPSINYRYEF